MDLGIYVHVPFCPRRCRYCDFPAQVHREDRAERFLRGLETEVRLAAPLIAGRSPVSCYLGGGTPTVLSARHLEALLALLGESFPLVPAAEFTAEANPETVAPDKLRILRERGCNRLSLGVQAWDDRLLAFLGRGHTVADARRAYRQAREAGFGNVGVDLIYGLPGQTLLQWKETLRQAAAWEPEHVSAYSLEVLEGTAFARWEREGRFAAGDRRLPDADAVADMYLAAREILTGAGYEHYEISNFARPGFRSRHNQLYWRNQEYLGLGPGAHSHLRGRRRANTPRMDEYLSHLAAGRLPAEEEPLDERRQMSDTVILGLRLLEGVPLAEFRLRFGRDLRDVWGAEVEGLSALGLVEVAGGALRLTERALPLANQVFWRFL